MSANPTSGAAIALEAGVADAETRLDIFLARRLAPEYSRTQVARMIRAGLVRLNGAAARAAATLRAGDAIEIAPPPPAPDAPAASGPAPPIEVIFADDEMIVVNKRAGITVHPAPGTRDPTLVDGLIARFPELARMVDRDGVVRPGIVHRLDRETSGVMVVARTPFARAALARQFKERTVGKVYVAIVRGLVSRERITIARPIGRHPVDRKRMSVRSHAGRDAVSQVAVLARFDRPSERRELWSTLVRIVPRTGRTHQIRVHLASIGHPCLGDRVYGAGRARGSSARAAIEPAGFARQALHALELALDHPRTGERLSFLAPIPADMAAFLAARGVGPQSAQVRDWLALR